MEVEAEGAVGFGVGEGFVAGIFEMLIEGANKGAGSESAAEAAFDKFFFDGGRDVESDTFAPTFGAVAVQDAVVEDVQELIAGHGVDAGEAAEATDEFGHESVLLNEVFEEGRGRGAGAVFGSETEGPGLAGVGGFQSGESGEGAAGDEGNEVGGEAGFGHFAFAPGTGKLIPFDHFE